MRKFLVVVASLCAVVVGASCSDNGHPSVQEQTKPAAPTYPPGVDKVTQKLFGNEAEIIAYGDLAKNGSQQALIIDRVKITPETMAPGLLVTRAAIIEKQGDSWNEVLLVDEHLKNPKGFLGGQPISPVNGWRIQKETNPQKGLELYFTPLQKPAGGYVQTYEIRWNPEVKRYESMDRSYENFLKELPSLEPIDER